MLKINTTITGSEFNAYYGEARFYKILNYNLTHFGFTYKIGINKDTRHFNPSGTCNPGGLYFAHESQIRNFLGYGHLIANVIIEDDALVYIEEGKFKANKIIIDVIEEITDTIINECIVKNPLLSIKLNPINLLLVKFKTYKMCLEAVKRKGDMLQCVKFQTEEICKIAVQQNGLALKYVNDYFHTKDICKLAVQQDGYALQYVKECFQSENICKLAVLQNSYALQYVKCMTEEICKLAIQQDGCTLQYIKFPTEEICKLAVQQNGYALQFVPARYVPTKNISNMNITWLQKIIYNKKWEQVYKRICKLAVQQDGCALQFVNVQTRDICKLAVQQNINALYYVHQSGFDVK